MKPSITLIFLVFAFSCGQKSDSPVSEKTTIQLFSSGDPAPPSLAERQARNRPPAKFEPVPEHRLLFVGNNLEDIGGTEGYDMGYLDHFDTPTGLSMNIKIRTGDSEYGYLHGPLSGFTDMADWGRGPHNMATFLAEYDLINCAISLGIDFGGHGEKILSGYYDDHLMEMAGWLSALGDRAIFLRIGYEFDQPSSLYKQEHFTNVFRYVRAYLEEKEVDNVTFVWHAMGDQMTNEDLEAWYPGDDAVDWIGFSYYYPNDMHREINFALAHNKPIFLASATPVLSIRGQSKRTILAYPDDGLEARNNWFTPLFQLLDEYPDVIRAITYVHSNWQNYPMNRYIPRFQHLDSRLFINKKMKNMWQTEVERPVYLRPTDDMWNYLAIQRDAQ